MQNKLLTHCPTALAAFIFAFNIIFLILRILRDNFDFTSRGLAYSCLLNIQFLSPLPKRSLLAGASQSMARVQKDTHRQVLWPPHIPSLLSSL